MRIASFDCSTVSGVIDGKEFRFLVPLLDEPLLASCLTREALGGPGLGGVWSLSESTKKGVEVRLVGSSTMFEVGWNLKRCSRSEVVEGEVEGPEYRERSAGILGVLARERRQILILGPELRLWMLLILLRRLVPSHGRCRRGREGEEVMSTI